MTGDLDRLAAASGFVRSYRGLDGNMARASDEAVAALLKTAGIDTAKTLGADEASLPELKAPDGTACYLPDFLERGRAWGVTCQLYGLRSQRNWGIGDFEDLARLGELAAAWGADFLGVNPLHALFLAEPQWASPFFPTDRNFLNPLYIAVDRLEGFDPADADEATLAALREKPLIDYGGVAGQKLRALRAVFERMRGSQLTELEQVEAEGGEPLRRFALFQAISIAMKRAGSSAGWFSWPDELRYAGSEAVERFARDHADDVAFQVWLQWQADRQLGKAARRLSDAGMRIGLYLDLAVGTAPDGAATWADPSLTVVGAEIGAPPDMFNPDGQKWGLAPVSPSEIAARNFRTVRRSYDAILRHAGALRIDHAMSLYRLFWIPGGFAAKDGAYALYPMTDIVRVLAEVSQTDRAVIIGEDLGVVPEGFRDQMEKARILGYRLFYFERNDSGFIPPEHWQQNALACVGSHDTPTLAGWWSGHDIGLRRTIGLNDDEGERNERDARRREKDEAMAALRSRGLPGAEEQFGEAVAVGIHRMVARAPSRLMAAQLDDLVGAVEQPNIPGTVDEHPNWRRKLPVALEELDSHPMLRAVVGAIAEERPRSQ